MATTKQAFLTIGATADFNALVEAALSPAFLQALEQQSYTDLSVQYGANGKPLFEKCKSAAESSSKVNITGFELDKSGLGRHMRKAKGGANASEGVVISHAGTASLPPSYHPISSVPLTRVMLKAPAQS
jgi:beta-1,4-N-acetylglucosaminyltransferase